MAVEINNRSHLTSFIDLNQTWISQYFEIEEADRILAQNPGKIIDDGGYMFSIVNENQVVGVCALFNQDDGVFQLARMAVKSDYQRRGYGDQLMQAMFTQLRSISAKKVYLLSNTRLTAAIALYTKYGFVTTRTGKHPQYARVDIEMEYLL